MRIGIFKGEFQYDVVNVFANHLADALRADGMEPVLIDIRGRTQDYAPLVHELENDPRTLGFVGFNGVGLTQRAGLGLPPALSAKPNVAWLVDHPIEHLARVAELRDEIIATIDPTHVLFLKGFGLKNTVCLPHAGQAAHSAPSRPWADRAIRILLPGTAGDPEAMRAQAHASIEASLGADWAKLYDELMEDRGAKLDDAIVERARKARRRAGDAASDSAGLFVVLGQAIRGLRAARRVAVVRALDEAGVAVDLCGKGWELFAFRNHRTLATRGFVETVTLMEDARFVLHVNPLFAAGLHERVIYGSLAGAVVATDANANLKRTFAGGRGLVFDDVEDLIQRMGELEETGGGAAMALAGQERMRAEHTWTHRSRALVDALMAQARAAKVA